MNNQDQKPFVMLIAVKVLLLVAFLIVSQSARTSGNQKITIGNPPFTECERSNLVAEYQPPAWQSRNTL
jgi:hypothetical protein